MISLLEVAERAYTGTRMEEMEWNMGLFRRMQQLAKDHNLAFSGPDPLFEVDDSYVDKAFEAAVDFLSTNGVYCITTNRAIRFDTEEVIDAAKAAPREIIIGEGRDSRIIRKRFMEDSNCVNIISGGHTPWRQEDALIAQAAYARVQRGDMIEGFNMLQCDGYQVHGLPTAVYTAKREAEMMREAVRMVGRPGMAITLYPILTSAGPMIAPADPVQGLRRTDGLLLSILPDMKVEADYVAIALNYERYGGYKVNGGCYSNIGGFCGSVEGAIVEAIAKALAAWLVYRDQMQYGGSVSSQESLIESRWHMEMETKPTEERMGTPFWPTYVVHRALERHTNIIRFGGFGGRSGVGGIGSETDLLSTVRVAMINTVIGSNLVCTTGGSPTPYHVEFEAEASDATIKARIKREELPDLIRRIDDAVKERLAGKPFVGYGDRRMLVYADYEKYYAPMKEMYDFVRGNPSKALIENSAKAKRTLKSLGLDLEGVTSSGRSAGLRM